ECGGIPDQFGGINHQLGGIPDQLNGIPDQLNEIPLHSNPPPSKPKKLPYPNNNQDDHSLFYKNTKLSIYKHVNKG
ncbi:hypothetical protein, partial [Neobacillus drentensis]|uniref:hypothetical protein n=1 Tax=Neobacillus drentensis TaxID=220684 RepID=UPI0030007E4C